jgi:hypothetical protein
MRTPTGQPPVFPEIVGTGFLVDPSGIVVTNRHVVQAIREMPRHPDPAQETAEAILFFVRNDHCSIEMLTVGIKDYCELGTFSTSGVWHGLSVPDIGFVQLAVCETPSLELATEDFYITDPALNSATICGEFHPMKHGAN